MSVSIGRTSVRAASSFTEGSAIADCTAISEDMNESVRHAVARPCRMNPSLRCDVRFVSCDATKSKADRAQKQWSPPELVSRFRHSYPFAARAHTNVGTKGTLATI